MKLLQFIIAVVFSAGCFYTHAAETSEEGHDDHAKSYTELSDQAIENADLTMGTVGSQNISVTQTIFGVIAPDNNNIANVSAKYKGLVRQLKVNIGDMVEKGEVLAVVENVSTGTEFKVVSPINGEVSERFIHVGELTGPQPMFEIINPASVWVELSAFPENVEAMQEGQTAKVYDLHHHKTVRGIVSYIAPQMTGGHIARARVELSNESGHWRPGMHVKADVVTDTFTADTAVKSEAIQTLRGKTVVFVRNGNRFESQEIQQGRTDGDYVEVISGLDSGADYVIGNSYLIKADILKQGAGHSH
ncbi:efflux RND transporter periplasmic adaptor subunit [Idiomarina sp. HP20-50]|uniref:efflux RND transporter periplasmic adaptor subunit n=1 Tax=Idiomarina sp. HP20-50 TaxID=3070813 RepID=UPI00294ABCB6|nr:efflux RND transporter periplasmic adaptor subunit [Idiomarina sp. HP20-50]MDV6315315.1 efflux RND transporter periplasmic adaptor subunit [Idiomarina sp. HP20-50]